MAFQVGAIHCAFLLLCVSSSSAIELTGWDKARRDDGKNRPALMRREKKMKLKNLSDKVVSCRDLAPTSDFLYTDGPIQDTRSNIALYGVLVKTPDQYKKEDLVEDSLTMFRSSRMVGSKLPMHLIAVNLTADETARFTAEGVEVHDFTAAVDTVKSWFNPPRSALADVGVDEGSAIPTDRQDAWATYFKFLLWNSTFDHVLYADADFQFTENIDELAHDAAKERKPFLTCGEQGERCYKHKAYNGFHTHVMILQTSKKTFQKLVKKASAGQYIAYTNSDQDVLECFFEVHASAVPWIHKKYAPMCTHGVHSSESDEYAGRYWLNDRTRDPGFC